MEAANGSVRVPPLTKDDDNPSTRVDYCLKNLVASHMSNPDLTPQDIAEASRSAAAAAAIAAKAARATADAKAAAAAKAVAAAKTALDLIASFPNKHLPPPPHGIIISNSSSSCELINHNCEVPTASPERPDTEHATSRTVDSNRPVESVGPKQGIQVTRKRGRPKSK